MKKFKNLIDKMSNDSKKKIKEKSIELSKAIESSESEEDLTKEKE